MGKAERKEAKIERETSKKEEAVKAKQKAQEVRPDKRFDSPSTDQPA